MNHKRLVFRKILPVLIFLLVVGLELLTVVSYYKNLNLFYHERFYFYFACLTIPLPALGGAQCIRLVNRLSWLSDLTDIRKQILITMFMEGIVFAYMALSSMTIFLATLLHNSGRRPIP